MGLGPRQIDKPPTARGPCGLGSASGRSLQACSPIHAVCLRPSLLVPKRTGGSICHKTWLFRSGFGARPALLLICRQPLLLLYSSVMELQAVAQRPNKCLPSSLMWYTAPVGSMGSLLEDKINFWVMHVGRNNLNETCTLLGYKLTVTTEEKRYGHQPAWPSQTFSCSVTACVDSQTEIKWCRTERNIIMKRLCCYRIWWSDVSSKTV